MSRSRYRFRKQIRDRRTNQDMDYDMALTHHYFDSISIPNLQNVIHRRIPYLTVTNMEEFMPPNSRRLVTVTAFVKHVMSLYEQRKELIQIHFQQVQNRERRSGENVVIQPSASNPSPVPQMNPTNLILQLILKTHWIKLLIGLLSNMAPKEQ